MKKVLVIEDNPDISDNILEILKLSRYNVITAFNGKEGIEKALLQLPDIILCDIVMPQSDGFEVLINLRQQSSTAHIPVIYLSAKTEKCDINRGMEMGASGYICKPFDISELIDTIEKCLKK